MSYISLVVLSSRVDETVVVVSSVVEAGLTTLTLSLWTFFLDNGEEAFKASIQGHSGIEDFSLSYSSKMTLFLSILFWGKDSHHAFLFWPSLSSKASSDWPSGEENLLCSDKVKLLSGTYLKALGNL